MPDPAEQLSVMLADDTDSTHAHNLLHEQSMKQGATQLSNAAFDNVS